MQCSAKFATSPEFVIVAQASHLRTPSTELGRLHSQSSVPSSSPGSLGCHEGSAMRMEEPCDVRSAGLIIATTAPHSVQCTT